MQPRIRLITTVLLGVSSWLGASEPPAHVPDLGAVRANVTVTSVRLTDNGDNDGFPDPHETVSVYVTLRNNSGTDRQGIVLRMGGTDPTVACIPTPVASFGSLMNGEIREGAVPLVFRVADVVRSDYLQDLPVTLEFAISGDDFDTTTNPQSATLEADLNVSGGLLPTSYSEGFEGGGFGSFTTQSLDVGRESPAASDGYRCQYNDPDFANSNSYGNTFCYMGAPAAAQNAYDWHVHGLAAPDGGRAYLGNNSLHWGVHPGAASADTTRLRQLDAVRTFGTINLGWNGVASELSFKHEVGLVDCDYLSCGLLDGPGLRSFDRGIVQVQLANSAGQGVGSWRKVWPYENVYDTQAVDDNRNCTFDPVDDGSTEDDYFDPMDPDRRLGPSSTCYPEFAFSRQGAISFDAPFNVNAISHASDGPGLQGVRGPGTWVQTKFRLDRWRGRRLRLRFLATSFVSTDALTMQQILEWNPIEADDGWYIDDVKVSNTLTGAATVSVDTADRSALPACGPVCTGVSASLVVTPDIAQCLEPISLDASGSTADQCPGGALQFRFWWQWLQGEVLYPHDAALLQDWSENGTISHRIPERIPSQGPFWYRVDVRCSTLPACQASTTVEVPMYYVPQPLAAPYTLLFDSATLLSWGTEDYVGVLRGNLDALRASGGDFNHTVDVCLQNFSFGESLVDASVPGPGEGRYYLLRGTLSTQLPGTWWWDRCVFDSWTSGSGEEVPGAGGDRDEDLELDPDTCQ